MATHSDTYVGSLAPVGELIPLNVLAPSGTLGISVSKFQTGSITPAGSLIAGQEIFPAGSITPTGALSHSLQRVIAGSIGPSGSLSPSVTRLFSGSTGSSGTLSAGIGEAPCNIFLSELRQRTAVMLEDPGMIYYTPGELTHSLNFMQRLYVLLTLAIERTVSFPLTNGITFYEIDSVLSDFIAPLRITFEGVRLRPMTLHSLNMLDGLWRLRTGPATHYVQEGMNLLGIYPTPASGVNALSLTYAAEPSEMVLDSDFPEIASEQQIFLQDGAYYLSRLKEGGAEAAGGVRYFKRFLEAAQHYGSFVRARSRAQLYDRTPFDLSSFDKSRFEIKLRNRPKPKESGLS